MGCSYYAHSVIGVRIDPTRLATQQRVKAFDHDHPEDWEVDPKTGRKLWEYKAMAVPGVVLAWEDGNKSDHDMVCGYPVIEGQEGQDIAVIAMMHGEARDWWGGNSFVDFTEIPDRADWSDDVSAMKTKLRAFGFWDEEAFGLYTLLTVNC